MDIYIPLTILGVPDEATADAICMSIRRALNEDHETDMLVEWELSE
jgi:hypothetical protein